MNHEHLATVFFICVFVSILISPYMSIFYRMFSLFNVILLKSIGPLVRYIINIISFVAIESADKEQSSDIHRHHGSLFEDTFFLNFKNLVPLCLVSVNIYIIDFFQMIHDLVQKVKHTVRLRIRKNSPLYYPSILISASQRWLLQLIQLFSLIYLHKLLFLSISVIRLSIQGFNSVARPPHKQPPPHTISFSLPILSVELNRSQTMTLKLFYIYMTDFCIVPQSLAMQCAMVIFPFLCNFLFSLDFIIVSVFNWCYFCSLGFSGGSDDKESACNAGDRGLIPESETSAGEGNGSSLQYSCLENSRDGGAWWAVAHVVTKSQTRLSDQHFFFFVSAPTFNVSSTFLTL